MKRLSLALVLLSLLPTLALGTQSNTSQYNKPVAEVFGTYSKGCIRGAVEMPRESNDYQLQVWGKGRNYAHPDMISYLNDLIKRAKAEGLPPLLFSDLSLKYGGPYGSASSHASHNVGLDVDIPFDFAAPRKSKYELSHPQDVYLVRGDKITANFDKKRERLIYLAAQDDRVERIFVAPRIKERMCQLYGNDSKNDEWLRRLRPWFGHRAHMHVRLACPIDSKYCVAQSASPKGNGCGYELQSWFMPPDPKVVAQNKKKPKPKKPQMPAQCALVLQGK